MPVALTTNIQINAQKAPDNRYGKEVNGLTVPFVSVAEALTAIVSQRRYIGLTIMVDDGTGLKEYWLKTDTTNFVEKTEQSGLGAFSILVSTAWDGSEKKKSLTANESWTLSSTRTVGVALVTGNGFTLSINGTSIPLNPSGGTIVGFIKDGSSYFFDSSAAQAGTVVDTTPPIASSASVENGLPTQIIVALNENLVSGTIAASKFSVTTDGTPVTVTSVTTSGNKTFVNLSTGIAFGNIVNLTYTAGTTGARISDISGNFATDFSFTPIDNNVLSEIGELIDFSGSMTNETQLSPGIYKANSGSTGSYIGKGLASKKIVLGNSCILYQKHTGTSTFGAILGINAAGPVQVNYLSMQVGAYIGDGTNIYIVDQGTVSLPTTHVAPVIGRYYGIRVNGSGVWDAVYSTDTVSWTSFHNFTYLSDIDVYIVNNIDAGKQMVNPKGTNIT